MEDVVVKVVADVSDITSKLGVVKTKMKESTTPEGVAALEKAYANTVSQIDKLNAKLSQTTALTENEVTVIKKRIQALNANKDAMDKVITASKKVSEEIKNVGVESAKTSTEIKKTANVAGTGFTSLRQEIRSTTQQLAQMELAGKTNTEEYRKLVRRLGELKDAMNDVSGKARFFADDQRWITATTQAVQGLIGAYSIYQGVVALAGSEDKELAKSMQKLQGLMAIMMGLTQVSNVLQKDSMVMSAAQVITEKVKAAQMAITNRAIAANIALTETSTIAARTNAVAWNVASKAMKAVPVLLIVTAAIAIATAYIKMKDAAEKYSNTAKVIREVSRETAEQVGKEKAALEVQLLIAKDVNNSLSVRKKAIENINKISPEYLGNIRLENINTVETTNAIGKYIEALSKKAKAQAFEKLLAEKEGELISKQMERWDDLSIATKAYYEVLGTRVGGGEALFYIKLNEDLTQLGTDIEKIKKAASEAGLGEEFVEQEAKVTEATRETTAAVEEFDSIINLTSTDLDRFWSDFDKKWEEWNKSAKDISQPVEEFSDVIEDELTVNIPSYVDRALAEMNKLGNEEFINKLKENWDDLLITITDTLSKILSQQYEANIKAIDEYISNLDKSISATESALEKEKQLRENGSANNVAIREKELAELTAQKEKYLAERDKQVKKEKTLEKTMATVQAAISAINIISQNSNQGPYGWVAGVIGAAAVIAEIALLWSKSSNAVQWGKGNAEILGGRPHSEGGTSLGAYGTAERGEFLGILRKDKTQKYGKSMISLFDGINKNNEAKKIEGLAGLMGLRDITTTTTQTIELKEMPEIKGIYNEIRKPQKTVTYDNGKRIEKTGNHTRIIYVGR